MLVTCSSIKQSEVRISKVVSRYGTSEASRSEGLGFICFFSIPSLVLRSNLKQGAICDRVKLF